MHFITRQNPVGKWMCVFTEEFLRCIEGTEETDGDILQRKAYNSPDEDISDRVKEAEIIFSIVRDQYLKDIKSSTDSRTLLESVPVYCISPQLKDSCFRKEPGDLGLGNQ